MPGHIHLRFNQNEHPIRGRDLGEVVFLKVAVQVTGLDLSEVGDGPDEMVVSGDVIRVEVDEAPPDFNESARRAALETKYVRPTTEPSPG